MNRLHPNGKNYVFQGIDQTDGVYNLADENFKDDTVETGIGDVDGSDPSMAGYNKGWQMDPYEQRYYADKRTNKKEAAKETMEIVHTAEGYAKEILALWSQVDGPLQNFFESFTMNKMDNNMVKEIAAILNKSGYEIYPVLTDRRSRYASISKKMKKLAADGDKQKIFDYFVQIFPESVVTELVNDINSVNEEGYSMDEPELNGIIEFYVKENPEDQALNLLNTAMSNEIEFVDFQLSDATLTALENILSGQADPLYNGPGYNEEATDRDDIGVPPNQYETRISKRLKKKTIIADQIENIPYYEVMDAINQASRNVAILLNRKLQVAPVFIKSIRKQEDSNAVPKDQNPYTGVNLVNIVSTYEIWEVFLEYEKTDLDQCYVVISGDYTLEGYKKGKWSNIKYCGFYSSPDEAENEINSYLK